MDEYCSSKVCNGCKKKTMERALVRETKKNKRKIYTTSILSCTNCKEIVNGKDDGQVEKRKVVDRDVNAYKNILELFHDELNGKERQDIFKRNNNILPTTRGGKESSYP